MTEGSARRAELLSRAYEYVLAHGIADLSLRPLATAIGSSPRVLLFLFDSKEGLIRELLGRARAEELEFLADARPGGADLPAVVRRTWEWLADPAHRPLLTLWVESYARSLVEPDGPWGDFANDTVRDWLAMLAKAQPPARRRSRAGAAERTQALALLRGALLDVLATGDVARTTAAIHRSCPAPAAGPGD